MVNLRRSVFITFLSSNMATVMQFGLTIVLSRLLTPAEVGIFSITVVFINIIAVFRDFGVSSYLQQEKNLTPAKAQSALGLLLTSSWILAAATFLCRNYIAEYYREPGIASVLSVLCISYAIVPFAAFYHAILGRNLEAGKQAVVNIISTIAYATTCLGLAFLGFSYMALAWANVANIAVSIIVFLWLRPKDYPCHPVFKNWSSPIKFGSGAIVGNLLSNINNSIPDLVLGKVSGAHDVGLYSRANGLVGIFQQVAGPTIGYNALPFIARNHHDNVPLGPILAKATSYLTGLAWPAFIVTAIFAEEIIGVLYGSQWIPAAPIVVLIAIQSLTRFGYSLTQPALLAIGRPHLSAFSAGTSVITRLTIVFLFGARDIMTFASALCIADVLTVCVPAILMAKYLNYSYLESANAHWHSIKVAVVCLIAAISLKYALPHSWSYLLKMSTVGIAMTPIWLIAVLKLKHPLKDEIPGIANKLIPNFIKAHLKIFNC